MATRANINTFHKGEYVEITLFARARGGGVIATPASQTIEFKLSATEGGDAVYTASTTVGEITLTNEATGEFTIQIPPADLSSITENQRYFYNIWSKVSAAQPVLQAYGDFTLKNAIDT